MRGKMEIESRPSRTPKSGIRKPMKTANGKSSNTSSQLQEHRLKSENGSSTQKSSINKHKNKKSSGSSLNPEVQPQKISESSSEKIPGENDKVTLEPYYRKLFDAIYTDDVEQVKKMVRVDKINVNIIDEDDPWWPSPLLAACEHNRVEIVRIFVKAKPKVNVNASDKRGKRPIWWAAKHGSTEITDMLIYDGNEDCDVDYLDEDSGCTPLYRAILSDAAEVCRLLVHAGADVNLRRLWKSSGETEVAESPLVKSVQMGNLKICEVLVNSLCSIHAKTADGFTALHYAVGYRRYDITSFLLENRIRVNVKSRKGVTAMTIAIREQLPTMCKILIEWGYDMDKKFKWDETPLEMAIRLHAESCAMILVAWGCKIAKDRRFWFIRRSPEPPSIFFKAANEGHVHLMKLMIEIYPYFLYEDWIRNRQIPLALYRNSELCDWLYEESSKPRSLMVICKSAILKYLGKYGCSRLDKLPLPEKLKDYLRVDHHFCDKMYRKLTLEDHECPYYCPPSCPRNPQCPELDFSDSASDD